MSDHNLLKMLLDKPIAFHRAFVTLADGYLPAAIMLSQAVYWSQRTPDGWFYKTREQWYDETGLTRREQDAARKILRLLGFWTEALRGYPAKVHFSIDFAKLSDALSKASSWYKTYQQEPSVGTKRTNKLVQNVPTDIICSTETTTETTNSACHLMSNDESDDTLHTKTSEQPLLTKQLPATIQAEWDIFLSVYPKPHRNLVRAARLFSHSSERMRIIRNARNYASSRAVAAGYVMSVDRFIREGYLDWDVLEQPLGFSPAALDTSWRDEHLRDSIRARQFHEAVQSGKIQAAPRARLPWESEEEYQRKIAEGRIGLIALAE